MDSAEVRKVASLARLSLTDQEVDDFGRQLTQILSYVETLNDVDVENAEPMPHAIEIRNVFREDERSASLDRDVGLQNAPRTDGRYFLVPQILDQKDA